MGAGIAAGLELLRLLSGRRRAIHCLHRTDSAMAMATTCRLWRNLEPRGDGVGGELGSPYRGAGDRTLCGETQLAAQIVCRDASIPSGRPGNVVIVELHAAARSRSVHGIRPPRARPRNKCRSKWCRMCEIIWQATRPSVPTLPINCSYLWPLVAWKPGLTSSFRATRLT